MHVAKITGTQNRLSRVYTSYTFNLHIHITPFRKPIKSVPKRFFFASPLRSTAPLPPHLHLSIASIELFPLLVVIMSMWVRCCWCVCTHLRAPAPPPSSLFVPRIYRMRRKVGRERRRRRSLTWALSREHTHTHTPSQPSGHNRRACAEQSGGSVKTASNIRPTWRAQRFGVAYARARCLNRWWWCWWPR